MAYVRANVVISLTESSVMYFLHSFTSFYSSALAGEGELLGHCMEMSGGAICLAGWFYLSHGTNSFIL